MLTENEKKQYSRHILLEEIGESGQKKLKKNKVLVIGAGGLGCPILQYLTSAGIGCIGIIDPDTVDTTNLQRQILFTYEDIGKPKVEAAKEHLQKLNKFIEIKTFHETLHSGNALDIFKKFDLIIEGTDSFVSKYLTNDAAILCQKPFILGSILKFEGQLSVFNYNGGPSYRCLFPEIMNPDRMPTCAEVGVLGVLPGVIGTMMATEAIKLITGIGEVLSGKLLKIDLLTFSQQVFYFQKDSSIKITELKEIQLDCFIPKVNEISYLEYSKNKEKYYLLDVRTIKEREKFSIGGQHIPLNELSKKSKDIPIDKSILIYCETGKRSAEAVKILSNIITEVSLFSLKGGCKI